MRGLGHYLPENRWTMSCARQAAIRDTNRSSGMRRGRYLVSLLLFAAGATALSGEVAYQYDEAGRLRRTIYPQGTFKTYKLDAAGNRVSVTAQVDTSPPAAPATINATATASTTSSINWAAATDDVLVKGYQIERCTGIGCSSFAQIGAPASTSHADSGLSGWTSYSYRVRAIDFANNPSAYSAIASITTPDTEKPYVPTGLTGSSTSSNAVNLSWNAATDVGGSGVAGYRLYRNSSLYASTASTAYTDTGVSGTTTYYYAVSAYDNSGNESSPSSPALPVTTPDTLLPSAPTITSSSLTGANTVSLSWSASTDTGGSGLAGYRIYRSCPGGIIAATSAQNYVDTTAGPAGATCTYQVAAHDNANNQSAWSSGVTFTLPVPPAAPGAIIGPTKTTTPTVGLSWASVSGATYYEVWESSLVTTVTSSAATFTRPQCFIYVFYVKACNVAGCSAYSPGKQVRVDKPVSCI